MKYKPLPVPTTNCDLAAQLRWLSEYMTDVAVSMDYYGQCGGLPHDKKDTFSEHSKELAGAAIICWQWANEIEQ